MIHFRNAMDARTQDFMTDELLLLILRHYTHHTLLDLGSSYIPEVWRQVGIGYACAKLYTYVQGNLAEIQTPTQ